MFLLNVFLQGLSNYKTLVLSGFDLEDKKSNLLSLALIPNQKETTINKLNPEIIIYSRKS